MHTKWYISQKHTVQILKKYIYNYVTYTYAKKVVQLEKKIERQNKKKKKNIYIQLCYIYMCKEGSIVRIKDRKNKKMK